MPITDDRDGLRQHHLVSSAVFCLAPWTQLHVLPTGEIFTCCMAAEPRDAIGHLRKGDTLESAWNSPAMRALRLNMLHDRPSASCHLCYAGERVGQSTLRTAENYRMAAHYPVVAQTAADGALASFRVPTLDLRFSNVCNLRCRICSAKLSSGWHGDATRLGIADPSAPAVQSATDDPDVLLQQVFALLPGVERLHFAGGEPLLSPDHYHVLERLPPDQRRRVQLTYNTNFSKLRFRHWDVVTLWRDFPRIYLQASLDGMGARGELMRKGLRWDDAVANRRRLLAECPHIDFAVHATVSAMNALHLPEFHRAWLDEGLITAGGMQLNILHGPPHYNVRALPPALKDAVERAYRTHLAFLDGFGEAAVAPRRDFEAVIRYMRAEDWELTEDFRARNRELDLLRDESLHETFPELAGWIDASRPRERLRTVQLRERLHPGGDTLGELDRLIASLPDPGDGEDAEVLRQAYRLRGRARQLAGDRAGATSDFDRAAHLHPAGAAAPPTRGTDVMTETDDHIQDAGALYVQARQQRREGDVEGALASLAGAVARAPGESVAWLSRRLAELEAGKDALLDDGGEAPPDLFANPAVVYYLRGLALAASGDTAAARADLERVAALATLAEAAAVARARLESPGS